jgi:hypothetical protein
MEEPESTLEFDFEESLNLMIAADFGRNHRTTGQGSRGGMVMSPQKSKEVSNTTFDDPIASQEELSIHRTTVC